MDEVAKSKMGRPVIGEPKDIRIHIRLTKSSLRKLDEICEKEKMSRSECVRKLIDDFK